MDKNRIKKLCEYVLESENVMITEFRMLPTYRFDDKNEWVPDSCSLFFRIKEINIDEHNIRLISVHRITNLIESLLGFECMVDF